MVNTTRNYRDNFDFKTLTTDVLIPKYFPDQDISTRTSGLIGFTTEQLSTISEDTFYATSTLLKEFFIQKASLPESIYAYASLFQLSNVIGSAAKCRFLLVLDEKELSKVFDEANMYATQVTQNVIYLSKNTTIYVEEIPFVLDYDIEITRKKTKLAATEYVYAAKYVVTEFNNSISDITNPYIKIRRSVDGYFAMEVIGHQCVREETTENLIDNSTINYPIIDVKFDGILAGFDAFYKAPGDTEYTQLLLRVENSLPEKDPFCFYKIIDENILRLSFSLNDSYFQPEFNSEIKIVTYTTLGKDGNFDTYTGKEVSIIKDTEEYNYNETFILGALVTSGSEGGSDTISLEDLRRLTATQFRTANVLSTDEDLEEFFNSYKDKNENRIKFIKRRDDLSSRLYTGFMVCKNEDYVYPTNTLDITMNYKSWNNPDGGYTYTQDPGYLYTYETENGYNNRVVPLFKLGFKEDKLFRNFQGQNVYQNIMKDYFKWLHGINPSVNPSYSSSEEDWESLYISSKNENETLEYYVENVIYTCPHCGFQSHRTFSDPDSGKELCYCCHNEGIKTGYNMADMVLTVFDVEEIESRITKDMFVYANPFLMSITKHPGLVNYYLTIINQTSLLDFLQYNIDVPNQFIINQATFERALSKDKEYSVKLRLMSSMQWNPELLIPGISNDDYVGKRTNLSKNYVRVMMIIEDGGVDSCYMEMVPTSYDKDLDVVTFECKFRTNDHVTLGNQMQIQDYTNEELGYNPYLMDYTSTEYTMDESEKLKLWVNEREYIDDSSENTGTETASVMRLRSAITEGSNTEEEVIDNSGIRGNFTYIINKTSKLIPMTDVEVKFVVLYKEYEVDDDYVYTTNNYPSQQAMFSLVNYNWTNIYSTFSDRVDFIKPLTMIRSSMYFRDDRLYNVANGDIYLYSSPMIKYSLMQHFDSNGAYTKNECGKTNYEMFTYLINQYRNQYNNLETVLYSIICQATYLDLKWYNTYGKSKNYIIGDSDEIIDRVNISIGFYIYLVAGTDAIKVTDEIKSFIKETIENLNTTGSNELHISNLMRTIENNFAYVDHIKFIGINGDIDASGSYKTTDTMGYSTDYQSIKNITKDINELSKEERFAYVPEMLCINKDQICLVLYNED